MIIITRKVPDRRAVHLSTFWIAIRWPKEKYCPHSIWWMIFADFSRRIFMQVKSQNKSRVKGLDVTYNNSEKKQKKNCKYTFYLITLD
jgi:hypothetical protein